MRKSPINLKDGLAKVIMIALCLVITSCGAKFTPQEKNAIIASISLHQRPIQKVNQDSLLIPTTYLDSIVAKARIIGVGEATHGTHESDVFNCEIIKHCVQHKNCKAICLESNAYGGNILNHYILGKTDKQTANLYVGMAQTHPTEPFRALIEWLRAYNSTQDSAKKVQIYGLGFYVHNYAASDILDFIRRFDPEYYKSIQPRYKVFTEHFDFRFDQHSDNQLLQWSNLAKEVKGYLERNRIRFINEQSVSSDSLAWIIQIATILEQDLSRPLEGKDWSNGYSYEIFDKYRDSCMAANAQWVIERTPITGSVVVWMHNGHIAKRTESLLNTRFQTTYKRTGQYLYEQYGQQYCSIGQAFGTGTIRVRNKQGTPTIEAAQPPEDSFESLLLQTTIPCFIISTHLLKKDVAFLDTYVPFRMVGVHFTERMAEFTYANIIQEFDALVFYDKTRASKPFKINLVQ